MTWPIAVALLSFSAPICAAIITRNRAASGVSKREFDQFARLNSSKLEALHADLRELRKFVYDRF